MACFLVPAVEAVVTSAITRVVKTREKEEIVKLPAADGTSCEAVKIKFSQKLGWLNKLLIGGSGLLAFEHVWHGEVVPYFPFLTAVKNGETAGMLAEMGSAGVGMAVLVTAVWCGMVAVFSVMEKKTLDAASLQEGEKA
ncbi:MAG: hypothetical protein PUF49_06820 [Firmicutes bacterium]|nr:hypothetical protein [Bacillota bacterium]